MSRLRAAVLGLYTLLAAAAARGQEFREIVASPDRLTEEALRAAFLGDDERLRRLAWECEIYERHNARQGEEARTLKENVAALAAARSRPLPRSREVAALLDEKGADLELDAMTRLLQRTEPRDRLAAARDARRYEAWRRRVNAATNAATGLLSLQLFPLLQPPLDAIDYALNGRKYLSPEERRELYFARLLAGAPALAEAERAPAWQTIRGWTPKRRATAMLQARRNALLCAGAGRLDDADWWFRREMLLAESTGPLHDEHRDVMDRLRLRQVLASQTLTVAAGEDFVRDTGQYGACAAVLRGMLLAPDSPETLEALRALRVRFPESPVVPETRILEAARERARGEGELARLILRDVAESGAGAWSARAEHYAARPDFDPEAAFEAAQDTIAARKWRYLLLGEDPRLHETHLSAEDARQIESAWIQSARSLFVIDVLGRTLALPFLPSRFFPREELFDAHGNASAEFLASPGGRGWTRETARGFRLDRRFEDAARLYDALGDSARAAAMRESSADAILRQARSEPDPRERMRLLRKIANAYPATKAAPKARGLEEETRHALETLAAIAPGEMRLWPELWRGEALGLPATLLDGSKGNGEVGKEGIALLAGGRVAWTDRASGERIEVAVGEERIARVLNELYPRRRAREVREELEKPRERKRIPIEVEGGAIPGFAVAPGLVPLEVDPAVRRLFE